MYSQIEKWIVLALLLWFMSLVIIFYVTLSYVHLAELSQMLVLLFAGFIQLFAGSFLYNQQKSEVFVTVHEILALIPTLMDLKGNLELTMASRVSTLANTSDDLKSLRKIRRIIKQNLMLMQVQVTLISMFAVFVTCVYVQVVMKNSLSFERVIFLLAISMTTGTVTCTVLGSFVTVIIGLISRNGYDPDDVATPIAAAAGDCITIMLLTLMANAFHNELKKPLGSVVTLGVILLILLPFPYLAYKVINNRETKDILKYSGPAVLVSTVISQTSGFIFERATNQFPQIALLQTLFAGTTGNSISMIVSLICTTLHRMEMKRAKVKVKRYLSLWDIFIHYEYRQKVSVTVRSHIFYIIIPCQYIYLLTLRLLTGENTLVFTFAYMFLYLGFAVCLMSAMAYLTCNVTHIIYTLGYNPTETVIPITTSIADVFGSSFLLLMFTILKMIKDPNSQLAS